MPQNSSSFPSNLFFLVHSLTNFLLDVQLPQKPDPPSKFVRFLQTSLYPNVRHLLWMLPHTYFIEEMVYYYFLYFKTCHRATIGSANLSNEYPEHGLVKDGTPCGDNLVCVNQTCVSIYPHIDQTKCPTNNMDLECFGHGVSDFLSAVLVAIVVVKIKEKI